MADEDNILIENQVRFSESCLWKMQREYFDKQGINAWVSQVPFYVTSNPFIAKCYAKITLSFIQDWISKYPQAKRYPFYILELGTGSGRFSYYVLKTLASLVKELNMKDITFCYIMSDFTSHNLEYYQQHPALKVFIEQGCLDFAIYNMENQKPICTYHQKFTLNPETLINPLLVYANYIFDSTSQDAFKINQGQLYESLLSIATHSDNIQQGQLVNFENVHTYFTDNPITLPYYQDPVLNQILVNYQQALHNSHLLFPIGGLQSLKALRQLANDRLFVISSDKGHSELKNLENLGPPSLSFHGSFSLMVNFDAIAQYFKLNGGDSVIQSQRKGIKTLVFCSGFQLNQFYKTQQAIHEHIQGFSPADYFNLHQRMSHSIMDYSLDNIASHLQLTGWDPHVYLKINHRIQALLSNGDPTTLAFMAEQMPTLAANYYHMPQSECILFEIGIFFHTIKRYQEAIQYYQQAETYLGPQFSLFYNMALCQYSLGQLATAQENFNLALNIKPESQEARQWLALLQKEFNNN